MMKLIASILVVFALVATANAQSAMRPVPQFIESLSDADYAIWARWQNRQAERRSKEVSANSATPRYQHGVRLETSQSSSSAASVRSSVRSSRGAGSARGGRSGLTTMRGQSLTTSVTTATPTRYLNPDYAGPGPLTTYNPWTRVKGGKGTPDWDRIFVPVKEGTMTVSEVMDRLSGPYSQEKVFKLFISDYFSEPEVK